MELQQESKTSASSAPALNHFERHGYLFGYPIAHSFAPYLHKTVFEELGLSWSYQLLESTDMDHFLSLLKDERLYGMSNPIHSSA